MALTSLHSRLRALAPAALVAAALAIRLAAAPGADLDATVQEVLGRAPRLDAYWYTRAAVDATRGEPAQAASLTFDRPLYTLFCRATYAVAGVTESTLPLPAILAGALGVGVLVLVGWEGGLGGAAVLAGAFAATNWLAVVHDREPLVYSTVNLAFLLSLLAWVRGLRSPRWLAVGWAGIAATAVWGKETVLLAVPALLLGHLMTAGGSRRSRLRAAAALAGAAALAAAGAWLAAPGAVSALVRKVVARASFSEIPFPGGWVLALGDLPKTLAVLGRIPAIAVLAAIGIAAVVLEGRNETGDRGATFRRVLVVWLVVGCAIVAGFSYRPTRYVLGLFAPAFLLAAHAVRVLWSSAGSPVRAGSATRVALLGVTWWVGLAALYSWLAALLPDPMRRLLPAVLWAPAFRLGVSAAAATAIALGQAASLGERGRLGPARRYAVALAAFVLLTDARAFRAHLLPVRFDDVAARRSFEAAIGPGARVMGYAAHYLAFDRRYHVVQEFRVDPASLLANPAGCTHLATLWVPELDYVERLMASAGAPLHPVIDVVVGRERYRVYRLPGAESRGYVPTTFERARASEDAGDVAGADEAYRRVMADGASDPLVVAAAGAALTALAPDEGRALLARARDAAPRNGLVWLLAADAAAGAGQTADALSLRSRAAALLPHELVLGFGAQPLPRTF